MRAPLQCVLCVAAMVLATPVSATFIPFGASTIPSGTTVTTPQTLSNSTGTIDSGGAISIASGNPVPLTMNGTATLINNGRIQTFGTGRALDSNSAGAVLNVTNTGLISSVSADAFAVRQANAAVSLTNSGTIQVTNGGQAIDWANITSATNKLVNHSTGVITAVGEDAVRPGQSGVVENAGTITATPTGGAAPTGSDGIDLRTEKNVTVTNTGTITGRHGIATDGSNVGPSSLTLDNNAGTIQALNGSGVNIDGVATNVTAGILNLAGATIKGGVLAAATEGDGDGIDVDGVLTLTNSGIVLGLGAKGAANNAEGIAAGGGTITNNAGGQIVGSTLLADAPNGDASRAGNGILIDNSNGGSAVAATTITNGGLIRGKTGFAIKMVGTFANTVTNNAGGIVRGAGTGGAAIQTGDGGDKVVNRGAIIGDNGKALDLQNEDDTLTLEGGTASIAGDVSGGGGNDAVVFDLGVGNGFHYSGVISEVETVELKSGLVVLDGANRIAADAALQLNGGTLEVAHAVGANGQTFASLALGEHSTIDLDFTSLTFNALGAIAGGKTLTVLDYSDNTSPNYAFRVLGDHTANAVFLDLIAHTTVNGGRPGFFFDGAYTNVVVPEPGSLLLFGAGAVGFFGVSRRRRQV